MRKYIVVCFYTKDTPYAQESEGLEESCNKFVIHCHRKGYQNRGLWVRNAAIKPEFLLLMFEQHPFQDIVYLDADARIKQFPKLFEQIDEDVGVHYRDHGNGRKELLSGTIYLKNNERVRRLIQTWAIEQQKNPDEWDQKVFARILEKNTEVSVLNLPANYCQIFDSMKSAGDPVIEHLQASRRFKKIVELDKVHESLMIIPEVMGKVRIRRAFDGTYYIVRHDKIAEAFLDKYCQRLPNEKRWIPRFITDNRVEDFRPLFIGKSCYIIGKGPSLDDLSKEDFKNTHYPVICLNESIHKVETLKLINPVFGLQQDAKLKNHCKPNKAPLFVSTKACNYYNDYDKAYIFDNLRLGLTRNALSVTAAITISKLLGSQSYIMMCFDACVNRNTSYAACIGYISTEGGRPERFYDHRATIERQLGDTPVEWILPDGCTF